jgi:tetraacyldisaccharide 4'-kinase
LKGKRVFAFAGIGDPQRFFRTLLGAGIEVARERAFADHHRFSDAELETLVANATAAGLTLVTTEKDFARLRGGSEMPALVRDIVPFKVALEFADAASLRKFLIERLFKAREKKFQAK